MPATPAWLAWAEALLNRTIDGSQQAAALARRLDGTTLQIDFRVARIRLSAHHGRLALRNGDDGPEAADASLSGSPPALLRMLKPGADGPLKDGAVQVRGDAEIASRYRDLFMLARPDPEEELSRWIGDFPARRLYLFAKAQLESVRRMRRTAGENIAEYLQEESRDLVNKTELEEFLRGVDDLRETADRIEARLKRLERRAQGAA